MSKHSNNLIISKLALLQVFYALYWPVNAKKNCFVQVRFIFQIVFLEFGQGWESIPEKVKK